jgi:hypothetical protein
MPTPILNSYIEQLDPLTAEESLIAAERIAVGTGSLKKGAARRIAAGWQRRTDRHVPRIRPSTAASYRAQLAGLGIGVMTEPVSKAPDA